MDGRLRKGLSDGAGWGGVGWRSGEVQEEIVGIRWILWQLQTMLDQNSCKTDEVARRLEVESTIRGNPAHPFTMPRPPPLKQVGFGTRVLEWNGKKSPDNGIGNKSTD